MSVNKVILVGNLGKDPELRKTQNAQMPVCSFAIATSDRRKDAAGQWIDQTEWHRIVTFGATAENCAKYLKKGRQVYIEGKLVTRKWADQEGKDRYTTEVIGNIVQFLGNRQDQGAANEGQADYSSMVGNGGNAGSFDAGNDTFGSSGNKEMTFDDDDIPF
jgi:single-strand DNA-binding protein